jgi:hypothetical protein
MKPPEFCDVDSCDRPHQAQGLCRMHYARWWKYGDERAHIPAQKTIGTRKPYIGSGGYLLVHAPDHPNVNSGGMIPEHRLMMSNHLNRPLRADETVHHINGNKLDNKLGNLELWSSRHCPGQRVEDLIAWAKEVLATYGPEADRLSRCK